MTADTRTTIRPRGVKLQSRWQLIAVLLATALVVFFFQFRPWEKGLLEDWQFALVWRSTGLSGYFDLLPGTVGRPLHLVAAFAGLALSNGGFVGMYVVLGLVSVGQFLIILWSFWSFSTHRALIWTAAFLLAVHPWWPAGDILRFLPAQVSCLGLCVFIGFVMRYLNGMSWGNLIVAAISACLALLTYQALAATFLVFIVMAVVLVKQYSLKRTIAALLSAVTPVVAVFIYTVFIAPILVPGSYEASLQGGGLGLIASLKAIAKTMLLHAPGAVMTLLLLALTTIIFGLSRLVTWRQTSLILLIIVFSPLSALAYASSPLHVNDPERISFPIGTTAWLAMLALPVLARPVKNISIALVAVGLCVLAVIAAAIGLKQWTGYSATQADVLRWIAPAVAAAGPTDRVLVMDSSGTLGDVYTFLPPHIWFASQVEFNKDTQVDLCTVDGIVRNHPSAAVYPIDTTQDCSDLIIEGTRTVVTSESLAGENVSVVLIRQ